jgi:hypothetical protein
MNASRNASEYTVSRTWIFSEVVRVRDAMELNVLLLRCALTMSCCVVSADNLLYGQPVINDQIQWNAILTLFDICDLPASTASLHYSGVDAIS